MQSPCVLHCRKVTLPLCRLLGTFRQHNVLAYLGASEPNTWVLGQTGAFASSQDRCGLCPKSLCQATILTTTPEPQHGVGLPGPVLTSSQARVCGSWCPGKLLGVG